MTSLDGPLLPASDAKYFHPLRRYIRLTRQERWTWEIKASSKYGFYSLLIIPFFFFLLSSSKVDLGRVKPAVVSGIRNPCYWLPLGLPDFFPPPSPSDDSLKLLLVGFSQVLSSFQHPLFSGFHMGK